MSMWGGEDGREDCGGDWEFVGRAREGSDIIHHPAPAGDEPFGLGSGAG